MASTVVEPDVEPDELKVFWPAKDWNRSRAFFMALGGTEIWSDDTGLSQIKLGESRFFLQNYWVEEWAHNFMVQFKVSDLASWQPIIERAVEEFANDGVRFDGPKDEPWGAKVIYVWDPAGVLMHFSEFVEQS